MIKIFDMHGNAILEFEWQQGGDINLADLPEGQYFISLIQGEKIITEKIIKTL